eukprot:307221-Prymnesium_polylepis.1
MALCGALFFLMRSRDGGAPAAAGAGARDGGLGADEGGNDLRKCVVLPHNRAAATCAPSQRS